MGDPLNPLPDPPAVPRYQVRRRAALALLQDLYGADVREVLLVGYGDQARWVALLGTLAAYLGIGTVYAAAQLNRLRLDALREARLTAPKALRPGSRPLPGD